jgi:SAM-dependent methyltransferase
MDYDATAIPAVYDLGRDHGPAFTELWMTVIAKYLDQRVVEQILDLGCGTARFSNPLASHFHAKLIGIDPSRKMLAQARLKPAVKGVRYGCGEGEAIPLKGDAIDMIFMSMVFHHLIDPSAVARECRRVLRPDGRVFVRTGTVEQIAAYPYVRFIPATRPLLEERLPKQTRVVEVFEAAGFKTVAKEVVMQETAPSYSAYADKLAAGGDSILVSLHPQVLADGLDAIRAYAIEADPQPAVEPIDLFIFEGAAVP